MKLFIWLFISLFSVSAWTQTPSRSAHRLPEESYEDAYQRSLFFYQLERNLHPAITSVPAFFGDTAERVKVPLQNLDLQSLPEVSSYEEMLEQFDYIRDTRFLTIEPLFPRRLTWLYPDDGCYARAELAMRALRDIQFTVPKKIFVFGRLWAATNNTAGGFVSWWYHVAAAYRVNDTAYVFDPAINPSAPLTLQEWNRHVGGERTSVKYSICAADTFDPYSDCYNPEGVPESLVMREQTRFLKPEWSRVKQLGRDPERELGDFPPWLQAN